MVMIVGTGRSGLFQGKTTQQGMLDCRDSAPESS
jgi:hypothetical protein